MHQIDVNEGGGSPDGGSQVASPIDGRVAAMGAHREEQMGDVGMLCDMFVVSGHLAPDSSCVTFKSIVEAALMESLPC